MSDHGGDRLAGTFGAIQIGAHDQAVLIDTTSRNYDTVGHLYVDHSFVRLPLAEAYRMHALLSEAIIAVEEAEPRQPGLWSNCTSFRKVRA